MSLFEFYKNLIFPSIRIKYLFGFLITALLILGDIIVEATGGTTFAYLHLLYIPIILAGLVFSLAGGIAAGLVAGFLMSPYMPTIQAYDLAQPFSSWAFRLLMFSMVGAMSGLGASLFRAYIKELELKNTTDPFTGLPNLNGLTQVFSELVQNANKTLIVIIAEVYQMQGIDTAIGEEGTNTLMKQVADTLQTIVGKNGILGRLQTQRFAILIPEESDSSEIIKKCESISESTYLVNNIPLFVEIRFGIARYPTDDSDLKHLTRKALVAINVSRDEVRRISHFDKQLSDSSERNLLILHQLKTAIDNKTLILEYQPKVYLKTDKVMGFEALLRWVDPLLGPVSPMEFIPLAEGTLLIHPLTKWVLKTALHQMNQWNEEGILVPVSVNFSIKNLHNPSMIETLSQLLETYQIPPHFLEVEVTETSVATSISTIVNALKTLREIGVRIAIDDYGTGQASQQYLFELPINVVKIDKLFVQSISHNPAAIAIVKNAISLAHELNLEVIAEGIETRHQYDLLAQWGCDGGQGYFMGRSMKEEVATAWLKQKLDLNKNSPKVLLD